MSKLPIYAILLILLSAVGFSWVESYKFGIDINCSAILTKTQVLVNGSYGVTLPGDVTPKVILTRCIPELTLYFNDSLNFTMGNSSDKVPFEIESGSGSSYLPTQVWSPDYDAVVHLTKNCTDSGANNIPCVIVGSLTQVANSSCFAGSCYAFKKSNSDYLIINTSAYTATWKNYTIEYWEVPKLTADGDVLISSAILSSYWQGFHFESGTPYQAYYAYPNSTGVYYVAAKSPKLYYIAVVRNESPANVSIFVNGSYMPSQDAGASAALNGMFTTVSHIWLGRNPDTSYPRGGFGEFDELRLSNKSRSATDILNTWNNRQNLPGYGLLASEVENITICTPEWICDAWGSCNASNVTPCTHLTDLEGCELPFLGDISDYDLNCSFDYFPIWINYPPNVTTEKWNLSTIQENASDPGGFIANFTINDTRMQVNASGFLSFNFTDVGLFWLKITAIDNSSNELNATFWANVSCYPIWNCSSWSVCDINNITICLAASDLKQCGLNFTGNLTSFNQTCVYGGFMPVAHDIAYYIGLGIMLFVWLALLTLTFIFRSAHLAVMCFVFAALAGFMLISLSIPAAIAIIAFTLTVIITMARKG